MAAATWRLPPELPPVVPDCVRAQVEHVLANGGPAGLQISPVPGSLPPLLRPGQRRVDAPPFQLDFDLCMHKLRCQVMLQRMGRSWVPDFVFPEAGFWPLAGAAEDGEAGAVLLAAMRGWDSADPSALLRLVLLVIDSYRQFQSRQVAEAARRDERLQFELDTMAGEGLDVVMVDRPAGGARQAVLSVPLRGVSLALLQSLLRPQPGLAAFAPPLLPPPSGAVLADRQSSDPSNDVSAAVKMARAPSMPGLRGSFGGRKASPGLPDTQPAVMSHTGLSRVSAPPDMRTGVGLGPRTPSSQGLQESPSGSDTAAAAFAETTESGALPDVSGTSAADETGALAAHLRLQVAFPVGGGGGIGPRTQLRLPPQIEALIGAAQLPAWTPGSCLLEYVPATVEALQAQVDAAAAAADLRRALLVTLADALGPPVDADGATFWGASYVMHQHGLSALVRVDLSPAFPQELPLLTLRSPEPQPQRRPYGLEVREFPWSPRWAASEMARRVYAVLVDKLPEWHSGNVQAQLGM